MCAVWAVCWRMPHFLSVLSRRVHRWCAGGVPVWLIPLFPLRSAYTSFSLGGGCAVLCLPLLPLVYRIYIRIYIRICGIPMFLAFL